MIDLSSLSDEVRISMSRRRFLGGAGATVATGWLSPGTILRAEEAAESQQAIAEQRYKIGVCDWMILKRQKLGAFKWTKMIGADGVEVDMGSLGQRETFDNKLADPEVRKQFLDEARNLDLEICSLAMSGFYAQSFAERPTVPRMLQDCIDTMRLMNVKIAFLPLGVRGDLVKRPELRPAIVERLKAVAPKAEQAGVVIGLETALDAAGDVNLLEDIGSRAIQIYFNFANALQNGRDLHKELRTPGKSQNHASVASTRPSGAVRR